MTNAIVTGGRALVLTATDTAWLAEALVYYGITDVLHGDCPTGVDALVRDPCRLRAFMTQWAPTHVFAILAYPADWHRYGKRAGALRNTEMVARCTAVDYCFHWLGGKDTRDCVAKAQRAGVTLVAAHAPFGEKTV